ncbi:MAG: DMT family transporter [Thermoactinomyces sp.]
MKPPVGFLLTISIVVISFASIFVKWSDAPATVSSMYRMYFASILLLPVVWMKKREFGEISRNEWIYLSVAGLFLALHFALWFGSLKLTTVASSTIILSFQPIIALLGGYLIYKERTGMSALITIGISIMGVVLIGWGDFGPGNQAAIIGDLLSFSSVIAVVCYLLIGQNRVKKISHWIYSFCVFLVAGLALNIYNLARGVPIVGYNAREWTIFLLLAIFPTIAHVIFNWLLNYVNTTTISMSILGEPVGATFLSVILLGERVTVLQMVGGFFVLLGVFLFLIQQKKEEQLQNRTDHCPHSC